MTTRSIRKSSYADYSHIEPLPDPERVNDLEQFDNVLFFASAVAAYFAEREDALISGEGYLCHEAGGSMAGWLVPDCIVVFGIDPRLIKARNGYVISEIGKPPDFILEVGSRSTGRRDYTVKRDGYAGYSVQEYWRFDHTGGDYHDAAIAGDALVDGAYQPFEIIEEADGTKWGHSPILGLDLCWVEGVLRVRIPESGEYLPTPAEWAAEINATEIRADAAEVRADAAGIRADAAEIRADAAESEAARLREELLRLQRKQN